ncbi:MAG: DedA family protein [Candidatus Aquicultorales bacterium]
MAGTRDIQYYIALLAPYVQRYGYIVAFVGMMLENMGVPVPAETAVIVLSFFAGRGLLEIWLVIPIAILGDIAGDSLGYAIGYFGGRPLVERYGRYVRITKERLDATEDFFKDAGWRTVFAGQFFSVTRATVPLVAGTSRMPYWTFLSADALAATILITGVSLAAFFFAQNLETVFRVVRDIRVAGAIVVIGIIAFYVYNYYRSTGRLDRRTKLIILGTAAGAIALVLLFSYLTGYIG